MKAWRADPLVWATGLASSRCFWNRPAHFPSRLSANSTTCSGQGGEGRGPLLDQSPVDKKVAVREPSSDQEMCRDARVRVTRRWRELDSNLRFRARAGSILAREVRGRLFAGGRRIRTRGPSGKGKAMRSHSMEASLSRVSTCRCLCESCRRIRLAMPRRAFRRSGTDGSNPVPSSGESRPKIFGASSLKQI